MEDFMIEWNEAVDGNKAVVTLSGKITFENSAEVRDKVKALLDANDIKNLVFELSSVKFIDSSGLGLLVSIKNTLSKKEGAFVIKNATDTVKKIMKQTGLDKYFELE
jgi:anti-anti-sigma factor